MIDEELAVVKVIFVEFEKGLGAADNLSIDFSCEKPIIETNNYKITSIFFIIYCCLKT
jgi:hypothetical protein